MTATLPSFVTITDSTLRDGSHAQSHKFTVLEVKAVVASLDAAGIPVIEVSHGDGLGGSSINYGLSAVDERELISAAVGAAVSARIACLLLPGIGTMDDIRAAADLGASVMRVATHCTEADIGVQHLSLARQLGFRAVGFLMMSHSVEPARLVHQARIMAESGAECVYVVDSAGALILDEVTERVAALVEELGQETAIGFHGHQNLSLGVANSLLAIRAGASEIDGCTRSLGAGAGNTPTEVLAAVCERLGIQTGVDVFKLLDTAEDVVRPIMEDECAMDRLSIIMGYAGVYSSFLKHAYRAAEKYGISGAEILKECGNRKLVGGQEDQILEIAVGIARG